MCMSILAGIIKIQNQEYDFFGFQLTSAHISSQVPTFLSLLSTTKQPVVVCVFLLNRYHPLPTTMTFKSIGTKALDSLTMDQVHECRHKARAFFGTKKVPAVLIENKAEEIAAKLKDKIDTERAEEEERQAHSVHTQRMRHSTKTINHTYNGTVVTV